MERNIKLNNILVGLMNSVLKVEEQAIQQSSQKDVSITEVHTLEAIGIGRDKTMTQVAGALKISVSTLTVAINKLVKKGYVERKRVPEDRRIVRVALTEKGAEVVREHQAFHMSMIEDIVQDMDDAEENLLLRSMENLSDYFHMKLVKPIKKLEELKLEPLNLNGLKVPVPIFQGGMGIGVSMWKLAAAVAKCGGVGVISAAQPGFMEPDFYDRPLEANLRALRENIKKAIKETKGVKDAGPIGVNIMCVSKHYEDFVETAVDAGARVIISGAGLPTSLPAHVKDPGVKLIPMVSSARAAGVIMRSWTKKYNRVPDAFIFEGPNAGGHLGFKEEQLEIAEENFYKTILEIKSEISGNPECKLIVAGGIYTRDDVKKALAYGADGVQLATRFVATEECDAPDSFKQAYINAKKNDCVIIKSPVGMPGRAIRNKFVNEVALAEERKPIKNCTGCISSCNPATAPYCITQALIKAATGDVENGLVFCGTNAYRIDKIQKVSDIFQELAGEELAEMKRKKSGKKMESDAEALKQ